MFFLSPRGFIRLLCALWRQCLRLPPCVSVCSAQRACTAATVSSAAWCVTFSRSLSFTHFTFCSLQKPARKRMTTQRSSSHICPKTHEQQHAPLTWNHRLEYELSVKPASLKRVQNAQMEIIPWFNPLAIVASVWERKPIFQLILQYINSLQLIPFVIVFAWPSLYPTLAIVYIVFNLSLSLNKQIIYNVQTNTFSTIRKCYRNLKKWTAPNEAELNTFGFDMIFDGALRVLRIMCGVLCESFGITTCKNPTY